MFAFYFFSVLFLSDVGLGASRNYHDSKVMGVTTWGKEGTVAKCDPGEYFHGFRVKMEADWGKIYNAYDAERTDHTALNAVELLCESETPQMAAKSKERGQARVSLEGPYGDWSKWYFCPEGSIITGAAVFSESSRHHNYDRDHNAQGGPKYGDNAAVGRKFRGSRRDPKPPSGYDEGKKWDNDDTAVNNVFFRCTTKFMEADYPLPGGSDVDATWLYHDVRAPNDATRTEPRWENKAEGFPKGDMFAGWYTNADRFFCKRGEAFNAFRARVEGKQGGGHHHDDTALNQLEFMCGRKPICEHVELTNIQEHMCFKKDKDGEIILDNDRKAIRYKCEPDGPKVDLKNPIVDPGVFLGTVDNCDHAMPQKMKFRTDKSRTLDVWDTYSLTKTANDAFKGDVAVTHAFSIQAGMAFVIPKVYKGKVYRQVDAEITRTDSFDGTMKSSDKKINGKRKIELRGFASEYDVTVPGYRNYRVKAASVGYRGTTQWTADAICWDKAKKNKLKVVPMDGKYESVAYAKEEMEIEDMSASQCKPQCKCEAVYSKQLYGAKCTAATGETSDRNKGDLVNGERFWCYVRKGACSKDYSGQLDTKTDKGLVNKNAPIPSDFEWSSYPCRNKQLVDAQGIHEKKKSRRLDTINPELMRPTTDGTGYAPGPVVSTESEIPTDPEIEEQEESTVRRLANPTPSPTTWLEAPGIPEFWPLYAMEECTCDQPGEENTITCHWHTWTCPSLKPTCFSWDIVWGDDWETLCK